ncbi:hypothetical protein ACO1KO_14135, partial [Staphylococcus aureus]
MFEAKNQFRIGRIGRGKTVYMNDHTRLRDGHGAHLGPHGELEGSMATAALASELTASAQRPETGVYAAL